MVRVMSLFVSLLVISKFWPQTNHFYYFTSLHGLQHVQNQYAYLKDIELKTGKKILYLRFCRIIFGMFLGKTNLDPNSPFCMSKIDHFCRSIAHAKWAVWVQSFFSQRHAQNDFTTTIELFCAKNRWKK